MAENRQMVVVGNGLLFFPLLSLTLEVPIEHAELSLDQATHTVHKQLSIAYGDKNSLAPNKAQL